MRGKNACSFDWQKGEIMRSCPLILVLFTLLVVVLTRCDSSSPSSSIEYQRSGGIVGFDDHLVIDANDHVKLTRRAGQFVFNLGAEGIKKLDDAIRAANLPSIPESSTPKLLVPDELSYRVSYQGRTIKTSDTAMPVQLEPVIAVLNGIIESGRK
jgi:hypothetical protein